MDIAHDEYHHFSKQAIRNEKRKKIKNATTSDHIHLLCEAFLLMFLAQTDHYGRFRENKSLDSILRS